MPLALPAVPLGPHTADLVFPPVCVVCRQRARADGAICPVCARAVTPLVGPFCRGCGGHSDTALDHCHSCLPMARRWRHASSVYGYGGLVRHLVHRFKYRGDLPLLRLFADSTAAAWRERAPLPRPVAIVPVPLHWFKEFRRGYNQADLLAHALAPAVGLPVQRLLVRARWTSSQMRLSYTERQRNLHRAFRLRPGFQIPPGGVLVLDDVLTTGATLDACTRVLLEAGAPFVDVLTLARR